MRKNNFFENELDEEINNQIRMGLNDKKPSVKLCKKYHSQMNC